MALTDQQMQFANMPSVPVTGLDKATERALGGIDNMMNNLVAEIGNKLDGATAAMREMGKGSVADLASNKLDAASHSAPNLTPSNTPDISQKGNSTEVAKSMVPEKVIAQAQSIGNAGGLAVEHVAEANIGTLAPAYTPSMGAGRSQGMAIG